jgi:hypothetical protein
MAAAVLSTGWSLRATPAGAREAAACRRARRLRAAARPPCAPTWRCCSGVCDNRGTGYEAWVSISHSAAALKQVKCGRRPQIPAIKRRGFRSWGRHRPLPGELPAPLKPVASRRTRLALVGPFLETTVRHRAGSLLARCGPCCGRASAQGPHLSYCRVDARLSQCKWTGDPRSSAYRTPGRSYILRHR